MPTETHLGAGRHLSFYPQIAGSMLAGEEIGFCQVNYIVSFSAKDQAINPFHTCGNQCLNKHFADISRHVFLLMFGS
jgi:hypothetical protein